jgi:hypothetical protein
MCAEALADTIVQLHIRDFEALLNRALRALAKAGVLAAQVTGSVEATDLETTAPSESCGRVTRTRQITDKRGHVHEIAGTVYGWPLIGLLDARPQIPWAATGVPIQEPAPLSLRALGTQARTNLAGHARLHKVVFDKGCLDGVDVWWLEPRGITCVVPATANMAVTADARAQAVAGDGITVGRRGHTLRHGQGKTAWSERLETEVVGITGLTTYDQYGTPDHGRHHNRRDFQPNPLNGVVVRTWHGRDYGPGGTTVFLTNASVDKPLQPFDDDDDRCLIEHGCIKESKQPWSVKQPPKKTARAVRVHVVFTLLMFALATAYRLQCEQADSGGEPLGWQRWRRQILEQTRDHVIVFAQNCYGIFQMAEYSLLLGVKLKDVPPGIGTRQQILAKYRLAAHG